MESTISLLKSRTPEASVLIVIACTLLLQLLGQYFGDDLLAFGQFLIMWPILRILLPLAIMKYLGIRTAFNFLRAPRFKGNELLFLLGGFLLLAVLAFFVFFSDGYLQTYRPDAESSQVASWQRLALFTMLTIPGWEFIHRVFLFGGLLHFLRQVSNTSSAAKPEFAMLLAVSITTVFEVIYHFQKPLVESLGLVLASPFLCYLTYRTRSFWPALAIHLAIEAMFIFYLT